jgi:SAM-dependent methyltransferase
VSEPSYRRIVQHYEDCLKEHGAGARAVDWKSDADAAQRYDVMLGLVRSDTRTQTLLDFGCGLAGLKDHITARGLKHVAYEGLDLSPDFAAAARQRHPDVPIHCCDILDPATQLGQVDYVVMNGIFTRRHDLTNEEMTDYMHRLLVRAYNLARVGLAFNVMSECVDWKGEALYHPPLSDLANFVSGSLSKHFALRNDYGLYECTCYVYRDATPPIQRAEAASQDGDTHGA